MNQCLIRRTSAANSPKPFSIRLEPIPFNEKAAFVESVCASLMDSRFGPGRPTPIVTDLRNLPDREPAVFCDMTIEGPVPCYSILPDSEVARRYMADAIRREFGPHEPRVSIRVQNASPSTMGRGSPEIPGTRTDPLQKPARSKGIPFDKPM